MNQSKNEGRVTVIMPKTDKDTLDAYCHEMDITVSQLIRRLVRQHLKDYIAPFNE